MCSQKCMLQRFCTYPRKNLTKILYFSLSLVLLLFLDACLEDGESCTSTLSNETNNVYKEYVYLDTST